MPAPTATLTAVSASTVSDPAAVAVTFTDRLVTPSPIEVWAPWVPLSASTDRSTVGASESPIVNGVDPLKVRPAREADPPTDKASDSPVTLSSVVLRVKVFVSDTVSPAAMVRLKEPPVTE